MYVDVVDLRAFYSDRLGTIARRLIAERIRGHWPDVRGEDTVIGVGYATPYLAPFAKKASTTLAFMPAAQGVVHWPLDTRNRSALVDDDALPLPDSCVDRVLVAHSLELCDSPAELLREIWRVLTPSGRVIVVVPNRSGVWARSESTPFGYGRPFGRGQLTSLLRDTGYTPVGWSEALAFPPFRYGPILSAGVTWERIGRAVWPAFSGVIIVDANKQLRPAQPVRKRQRQLRPVLQPALAPPG